MRSERIFHPLLFNSPEPVDDKISRKKKWLHVGVCKCLFSMQGFGPTYLCKDAAFAEVMWSMFSAQQVTNRLCKTLAFRFQRNCPITWTQQAEQPQWNMLSGWECVRRCYFSLACFQRRSVETHCGQADSLLIQDRRHVSDGLYLRCHIPSPRQWITPFTAQTGFDVPEQTLHSICF